MDYPLRLAENPGLAPYDVSSYKGNRGKNFYDLDKVLQRVIERYSVGYDPAHKKAMIDHLRGYGELVGGTLDELTEASHKEGKYGEIVKFDRAGNRIDLVVYSPEQKLSRKISYDYGIVNLDFHDEWKFPFTDLHRSSLAYLANQNGEGGMTCPLAMTDGMINVLKAIGTEEQKKKYLPLVAGKGSSSHFMAGQYVTERVGGSNVAANRTIARKGENGKWILNGEKWFCSNPGDLWVTTAKLEGTETIGLFLVPRIKDNGELNGHHILRKKDIIGSKGKLTVEIVYEDVEAETLGRPAHGIANLIRYVIRTSRVHVSIAAAGMSRRAFMEALEYSRFRTAYGKKIKEFSAYSRELAELRTLYAAVVFLIYRGIDWGSKGILAEQLSTPLMKYKSSSLSSQITHRAIMALGGSGIIGDYTCLPRLHNDCIINETWEGTHLIITDHALGAMNRAKIRDSFVAEVGKNFTAAKAVSELQELAKFGEDLLSKWVKNLEEKPREWKETYRLDLSDLAFGALALSEFLEQAVHDRAAGIKNSLFDSFAKGFAGYLFRTLPEAKGDFEKFRLGSDEIARIVEW
ncbi:acyl-CoA dehydrogenase, C-terminal domain protein [Leptospira broomii serovar Hurstbridge str. 5399]|uniref:Acyl-CoA dehydrogenase, C-terminal domain protein n=1 Tax=Leptospira broomii serovar Hurstbridge str. 5399 TaxID=1049789 RepID=T0F9C8_9LEPT|nr:acyl-CoA dehydrogenase family protein [Leptospira broomii]EQA44107.1 acyl-CoA dehydrogenase, C-terminal domain protein [Leptospira broomii serovar Hurstbridge str. 5399]